MSSDIRMNWDMAEHTLPTGKRLGMRWNTLCQLENDPGRGRTGSADWKLTQEMAKKICL